MTKQHPNVSIVIISHNTRALTLLCLESLIPLPNSERIVVDTCSTDGTIEAIIDPSVNVISANKATGYAAAAH